MRLNFLIFGRFGQEWIKILANFRIQIQKFQKNAKICKKTRWNPKIIGEDFFFKSQMFAWLKFKMNQKWENGPTWPTTHIDIIYSLPLGKIEDAWLSPSSGAKKSWSRCPTPKITTANVKSGLYRRNLTESAEAWRWPDLEEGTWISSENHRLISKVWWFLIFSCDFSIVVSLNVDYLLHCIDY
jgi:hypothetical protein